MEFQRINIPAAGMWPRDCELISLIDNHPGLILKYRKDSDDTYWVLRCGIIPAYKVLGEEFSRAGYLTNLPTDGAFFEILDSPWICEIGEYQETIFDKCKHCVFRFYDETIEIIAQKFIFEQLKEEPSLGIEQ